MGSDDELYAWHRALCEKCQRWYNASEQHICVPDAPYDKFNERAKLIKWLKDYEVEE